MFLVAHKSYYSGATAQNFATAPLQVAGHGIHALQPEGINRRILGWCTAATLRQRQTKDKAGNFG